MALTCNEILVTRLTLNSGELAAGPESAHQINDQADQKDEPKAATTDGGTAKIETTAAEENEKEQNNEE